MTINTKRLVIRPLTMNDVESVHRWQADEETHEYVQPPITDISETVEYLEMITNEWEGDHQTYYGFGIVLDDELIGEIVFTYGCGGCGRCAPGQAGIGYLIHKDFWGNGYEAEASEAMIEYCFSTIGAKEVFMDHNIDDLDSYKVIESFGFQMRIENEKCEYKEGKTYMRNTYVLHNPTL